MPKVYGKKNSAEVDISLWPSWVRRLFVSLREIPWASLTALSTLFGAVILFMYFRSIDHLPSDFSALVGLGIAAAFCAVALLVLTSVALVAPAAIYREYIAREAEVNPDSKTPFGDFDLLLLQLGGVGSLFAWIGFENYQDCSAFAFEFSVFGTILLILGFWTLSRMVFLNGGWRRRIKRGWTGLIIAILGLLPFIMLAPLATLFSSDYLNSFVLLLTLWVLVVAANALIATRLSVWGVFVSAVFVVVWGYVFVPLAFSRPQMVPTTVAFYLGIRGEQPQQLLVLKQTCELVNNAIASAGVTGNEKACSETWSELNAQVLSNAGDRWLVEFDATGGKGTVPLKLRLTIPRSDLQLVSKPIKIKKLDRSSTCTKTS